MAHDEVTGGGRWVEAQGAQSTDATDSPLSIQVHGAKVHNLKNVDVTVPLRQLVAVAGVSGSGKSSLAMGVLYAEGSRRYIEALSTYTRRRMAQAPRASVDSVEHVPAALALRQRPGVPGVRSTFGTSTELLNVLRLLFSRLGSHLCPNGHRLDPTIDVAAGLDLTCPVCEVTFYPPGAESLAFNSDGACPQCTGTGTVREVDEAALVPDPQRTIAEGAVAPWSMFGLTVMPQVVAEFGVRTDVPYTELTAREREIVMHGPAEQRHISVRSKNGKFFELDFTYRNARRAVEEALRKATTERGLNRVNRFISAQVCPACHGTRLSEQARATLVDGINLAEAAAKTLDELIAWTPTLADALPPEMRPMARNIVATLLETARRLVELGLGYLALDRASSTLSTGERQRVQLARAVRNQTTGVLYVLDEPSIGLHPSNVDGLLGVMRDLLRDGNSVVLVDHDVQVLREADWLIEIGPGSGTEGGTVLATGDVTTLGKDPDSLIGGFLTGRVPVLVRQRAGRDKMFDQGRIHLSTRPLHTVHALDVDIPRGRLTAVTGVSGSGKTTLILESLIPALQAKAAGRALPDHVAAVDVQAITRVNTVDATPIGVNVRSTVATYSGILDDLRRAYAATDAAKQRGLTAADFSYNTGSLRCPRCEGTGQVSLDVQFLPDVDIACPACDGTRYAPRSRRHPPSGLRKPGRRNVLARAACPHRQACDRAGRRHPPRENPAASPHRPRTRIPHPRRRHPGPVRRRGTAVEARHRADPEPVRHPLRPGRTQRRPPSSRHPHAPGRPPATGRQRRHRHRHRTRPGHDRQRRLRHRHGPRRGHRRRHHRRHRNTR
ncbi:excinuclease ABC subunit UvrA [Streptomyces hawaiiensis]|uniref:excinuclease ABC subunit UvrA n=1 Tax=Streptomyces hawaiiensis TaxID=67305 RepID=UPI001FEC9820|nr:excinuclease ABC subunit UvrA [Streptomyces hawaiiensis]